MYPVIGEPPLSGADQETITSSGLHAVTGADGYAGTCAARILAISEGILIPKAFVT
jgi:hypothetical protein